MRTCTFKSILDSVARLYGESSLTPDDAAIVATALDNLRITELYTHAAWRELDVIEQRYYAPEYSPNKPYTPGDLVYHPPTDAYYTAIKEIAEPDAMVVEGAGSTVVNRIYLRNGDQGGFPAYTIPGGTLDDAIYVLVNVYWSIFRGGIPYYFSEEDNLQNTPDLVDPWIIGDEKIAADGVFPTPTVRRATWADIDAAGIDRATVPLLIPSALPNTDFWELTTELPRIVPFIQPGKAAIGTVNAVTLADPRLVPASGEVSFIRREDALQVVGVSQTSVWVRFTRREPRFTTEPYAPGANYGIGDLVYDAATGLCYQSLTAANTGNAPTDATHWQPQEIPQFGQRFLSRAALADLYDSKDQEAKATRHEAKAQLALDDAYYATTRREGQFTRMGVLAGSSHQDEPSITSSIN